MHTCAHFSVCTCESVCTCVYACLEVLGGCLLQLSSTLYSEELRFDVFQLCAYAWELGWGECSCMQKPEAFDPLQMDFQVVMNNTTWVLGAALGPLQEQHLLRITELSLQLFILFSEIISLPRLPGLG